MSETPNEGRPRLLDLFCGAGGCTKGYQRAGFYVVGVDIASQRNYCGDEFIKGDALKVLASIARDDYGLGSYFDAIHASPPCQFASRATAWSGDRSSHPNLIPATQVGLRRTGLPYCIENVQEARWHLHEPIMLCGSQFGIPAQSHRYFEIAPELFAMMPPCCHRPWSDASRDHGAKQTETVFRSAIGCDWMTVVEARQAIPPAYTEFIGAHLLAEVQRRAELVA